MCKEGGQKAIMNLSPLCEFAAFVKVLRSVCDKLGNAINYHVARAGVEGDNVIDAAVLWQYGDIGNSSDILQGAPLLLVSKEDEIHIGYERRSLPSCRHISWPEVSHCRNACFLSNDGRFTNLERRPNVWQIPRFSLKLFNSSPLPLSLLTRGGECPLSPCIPPPVPLI